MIYIWVFKNRESAIHMKVIVLFVSQYAVIELTKGGCTYVTPCPTRWVFNLTIEDGNKLAQCFWPRDESKLSDWIERRKKPDPSQWLTFNVKILRLSSK